MPDDSEVLVVACVGVHGGRYELEWVEGGAGADTLNQAQRLRPSGSIEPPGTPFFRIGEAPK